MFDKGKNFGQENLLLMKIFASQNFFGLQKILYEKNFKG